MKTVCRFYFICCLRATAKIKNLTLREGLFVSGHTPSKWQWQGLHVQLLSQSLQLTIYTHCLSLKMKSFLFTYKNWPWNVIWSNSSHIWVTLIRKESLLCINISFSVQNCVYKQSSYSVDITAGNYTLS